MTGISATVAVVAQQADTIHAATQESYDRVARFYAALAERGHRWPPEKKRGPWWINLYS